MKWKMRKENDGYWSLFLVNTFLFSPLVLTAWNGWSLVFNMGNCVGMIEMCIICITNVIQFVSLGFVMMFLWFCCHYSRRVFSAILDTRGTWRLFNFVIILFYCIDFTIDICRRSISDFIIKHFEIMICSLWFIT